MVVKAKREIILWTSAPAALTTATQGRAEAMIYADVQVIAAAIGGSDEMEILVIAWQVGHRNVWQQPGGHGINLRNRVVCELRAAGGIENLHRLPSIRTRGI